MQKTKPTTEHAARLAERYWQTAVSPDFSGQTGRGRWRNSKLSSAAEHSEVFNSTVTQAQ